MIDIDTRLRVSRGIAKTETEASEEVFQSLRQNRGHPEKPPPTISDGWGGIREAMVQVWGKVPEYKGCGRPPEKKRPQDGWKYLQVINERDEKDRVMGTKKKAIFGEEETLLEIFEEHTAYVERTHLTMRQMNSRLIRKGLGFSKQLSMHAFNAPGGRWMGGCHLQPDSDAPGLAGRSNWPAERSSWTALEEANSRNGGRADRSGVVDREAAPNRANDQHIIGPLPNPMDPLNDVQAMRIKKLF